jgi:hypothetical protein
MDDHRPDLSLKRSPRALHLGEHGPWNRSSAADRFQSIQHVARSLGPSRSRSSHTWVDRGQEDTGLSPSSVPWARAASRALVLLSPDLVA